MADSEALRSRRKRRHAAGDHSLCRRCDARRAQLADLGAAWDAAAIVVQEPSPRSGSALDPRASLEGLARRLEGAHEADPADAAVARVLLATLQALGGAGQADDETAKFLAEFSRA